MSVLKGACIIGQSGGPTSVINASAAGVIIEALSNENITKVLAAEHGIVGVLEDKLIDCSKEDIEELKLLKTTPSSAIGSCRYKLKDSDVDDTEYKRILEIFKKYDVRYFFYNGGNDSMDTCNKISKYMHKVGYDCRILGIPKTIDNDLYGTDHCPGFGSAAKYIATTCAEISLDNKVYGTQSVIVFEIMGRNAGWLTAASALANLIGEGPDLIYLPEVAFSIEKFAEDVKNVSEKKSSIIVAVSEGVKDSSGRFISEYGSDLSKQKDAFGHSQMGGLASYLASVIKDETGFKTRGIELSLTQRCAAHCASATDVNEAYMAGAEGVRRATSGETDKMVAFKRADGPEYKCEIDMIPLSSVANHEKKVPLEWINSEGNGVTDELIDYCLPLIQGESTVRIENGLPRFARLKKIRIGE
ncbi:MAG: 6-phosphofructokinase [Ruminococcaceae bacterium]|nr:6-phosphofructokinase [Oscillospiraceae bacterium]